MTIKCPKCGQMSGPFEWKAANFDCEVCGDHEGAECPKCGELFDFVFDRSNLEAELESGRKSAKEIA